jgi:cytochrome P450
MMMENLALHFKHHDEGLDVAFDAYRQLREECPIGFSEEYGGFWVLSRFHDVFAAEQDWETFRASPGMLLPPMGNRRPMIPIDIDPPRHPKYRRLTLPFFTPQRMQEAEPIVRAVAASLADNLSHQRYCDASGDYASPLPAMVFCRIAGLPIDHHEILVNWVNRIFYSRTHDVNDAQKATDECYEYLDRHFGGLRLGAPNGDLFDYLCDAQMDGRSLTHDELLDYGFNLLTAGLDTTAWTIRSGLWYLAQNPEAIETLRGRPDRIALAVEEFLRCLSPVQGMARTVARSVTIERTRLNDGDRVLLLFGSANRDSQKFPNGDTLILGRDPNPHIAFGAGIHRCLGSNLARREVRIALEEFLRHVVAFRLTDMAIPWHGIGPLPLELQLKE